MLLIVAVVGCLMGEFARGMFKADRILVISRIRIINVKKRTS